MSGVLAKERVRGAIRHDREEERESGCCKKCNDRDDERFGNPEQVGNPDWFTIYLTGGTANCPACKGMAKVLNPRWIICNDCGAAFLVHRDGELERTVVAERVR